MSKCKNDLFELEFLLIRKRCAEISLASPALDGLPDRDEFKAMLEHELATVSKKIERLAKRGGIKLDNRFDPLVAAAEAAISKLGYALLQTSKNRQQAFTRKVIARMESEPMPAQNSVH